MLKVFQMELYQRITETMLDVAGEFGGKLESVERNHALNPAGTVKTAQSATAYSGTNEIQRNIL